MKRLPLPKPHHLVLVVGVLVSLGTLASGIAPIGPCGDVWVKQWLAPELPQKEAGG